MSNVYFSPDGGGTSKAVRSTKPAKKPSPKPQAQEEKRELRKIRDGIRKIAEKGLSFVEEFARWQAVRSGSTEFSFKKELESAMARLPQEDIKVPEVNLREESIKYPKAGEITGDTIFDQALIDFMTRQLYIDESRPNLKTPRGKDGF